MTTSSGRLTTAACRRVLHPADAEVTTRELSGLADTTAVGGPNHPRPQGANSTLFPNAAHRMREAQHPNKRSTYPHPHHPLRSLTCGCTNSIDRDFCSALSGRGATRPNLQNRPVSGPDRGPGGRHVGPDTLLRGRSQRQRFVRVAAGEPRHENGFCGPGLADERPHSVAVGRRLCEHAVRLDLSRLGCVAKTGLVVSA